MMNLILKTLSIGLLIAVAGCANTGTNNTASLGAAEDAPSCCGATTCGTKAKAAEMASLGAAEDAPSCASSCASACKTKCNMSKKNMKMPAAKAPGSSLGAFDDAAKTNCSSNGAAKKSGGCPFSGGN